MDISFFMVSYAENSTDLFFDAVMTNEDLFVGISLFYIIMTAAIFPFYVHVFRANR